MTVFLILPFLCCWLIVAITGHSCVHILSLRECDFFLQNSSENIFFDLRREEIECLVCDFNKEVRQGKTAVDSIVFDCVLRGTYRLKMCVCVCVLWSLSLTLIRAIAQRIEITLCSSILRVLLPQQRSFQTNFLFSNIFLHYISMEFGKAFAQNAWRCCYLQL